MTASEAQAELDRRAALAALQEGPLGTSLLWLLRDALDRYRAQSRFVFFEGNVQRYRHLLRGYYLVYPAQERPIKVRDGGREERLEPAIGALHLFDVVRRDPIAALNVLDAIEQEISAPRPAQ